MQRKDTPISLTANQQLATCSNTVVSFVTQLRLATLFLAVNRNYLLQITNGFHPKCNKNNTLIANSDTGLVFAYCILSAKSLMAPVFVYLLMNNLCKWLFSGVTTRQCRTPSNMASMFRNSVDFSWKYKEYCLVKKNWRFSWRNSYLTAFSFYFLIESSLSVLH